jgi:hypothetical protein
VEVLVLRDLAQSDNADRNCHAKSSSRRRGEA